MVFYRERSLVRSCVCIMIANQQIIYCSEAEEVIHPGFAWATK